MTTIYSVACCVFRKLFFGALLHLFLSQTEKTRENTQKGSTSVRCHCQMLADTQKLVDSWEKYDFSYFIENSDKKQVQFQTFQIKLRKFIFLQESTSVQVSTSIQQQHLSPGRPHFCVTLLLYAHSHEKIYIDGSLSVLVQSQVQLSQVNKQDNSDGCE